MSNPGGGARVPDAVRYDIVRYTRGRGVELGRGSFKAFPHFIALRERGDTTQNPSVAPDLACDSFEQGLATVREGALDFVFLRDDVCSLPVAAGIGRALKIGGYFVEAASDGGLVVLKKTADDLWETVDTEPIRDTKTACVIRYGAIGDTLQATSVLDELKREGYRVTWMCEPTGEELLRHDARIDEFFLQDKDQVPNQELPAFWKHQGKHFDRIVNLCESVEGTLIKLPGRADFTFPDAVRREICDHNYMEFTAKLAGLKFRPEYRFFANDEEREAALGYIESISAQQNSGRTLGEKTQRPFVILWALSGSSTHKAYPHMDAVIARTLVEIPHAHFVLVGDQACRILEVGWENEPRVHCESGELGLRDTLALAQVCDLVIGPETGVLNAVAFESMPKIIFLSHSSEKNLTRDWVNTDAMTSGVPCYPCHRLHYTDEFCPRDPDSRAAICAQSIAPGDVWEALKRAFVGRETVNRILTP